jgi:hypothetical protein
LAAQFYGREPVPRRVMLCAKPCEASIAKRSPVRRLLASIAAILIRAAFLIDQTATFVNIAWNNRFRCGRIQ